MLKFDQRLMYGVPEIDDEHRQLIDMANNVVNSYKQGDTETEILKLLEFLSNYVVEHFNHEEKLQRHYNYPKYEAHHAIHEGFKTKVKALYDDIHANGLTPQNRMKLTYYTNEWIADHIGTHDKELSAYILSQRQ